METFLSEAKRKFNPLSSTCHQCTSRWVKLQRVINNTEEEYVQAGLLFQTFYFPLKLKKKKKQKKTTDMSMAGWVGQSSWEMNHTFHSVL